MRITSKLKKIFNNKDEITIWRKRGVKIGNNCKFYNVNLDNGHPWLIEIGNNCTLSNCTILSHDASTYSFLNRSVVSSVIIGDNVFIGMNSIILCGTHIGSNVIVGAGSIVTKDIPNNVVVAGNPARILMSIEEFENKYKKLYKSNKVWNTHYSNKTNDEIAEMQEYLTNNIGFDI